MHPTLLPLIPSARPSSKYPESTRLGRQELNAEILEDNPGALWKRQWIEELRVQVAPAMKRIVVAIDPAATSNKDSDETGITRFKALALIRMGMFWRICQYARYARAMGTRCCRRVSRFRRQTESSAETRITAARWSRPSSRMVDKNVVI